jgi:pimeloyl-ACP methyl ester carboxylesterase
MALDVGRLLDHLHIQQAHVVGYSLGGNVTALFLMLHPERFLTATIGGWVGPLSWSKLDAAQAEEEAAEREKEGISRSLTVRLAGSGPVPTEEEFRRRSAAFLADPTQDRFALAAFTRANESRVIDPQILAKANVPTLGIVGSQDPNLAGFQELKAQWPDMRLVVLDGATHSGPRGVRSRPEFLQAVRDHIDGRTR